MARWVELERGQAWELSGGMGTRVISALHSRPKDARASIVLDPLPGARGRPITRTSVSLVRLVTPAPCDPVGSDLIHEPGLLYLCALGQPPRVVELVGEPKDGEAHGLVAELGGRRVHHRVYWRALRGNGMALAGIWTTLPATAVQTTDMVLNRSRAR